MQDYFDLSPTISLILLIIPITAWWCGIITRLTEGCYVAAFLRFFLGGWIIWIIELLLTSLNGYKVRVFRFLNL